MVQFFLPHSVVHSTYCAMYQTTMKHTLISIISLSQESLRLHLEYSFKLFKMLKYGYISRENICDIIHLRDHKLNMIKRQS